VERVHKDELDGLKLVKALGMDAIEKQRLAALLPGIMELHVRISALVRWEVRVPVALVQVKWNLSTHTDRVHYLPGVETTAWPLTLQAMKAMIIKRTTINCVIIW